MAQRKERARPLIGWREWVRLPDLADHPVKAKVDTGARTSTLHAFDLSVGERNGKPWVEFEVHPIQRSRLHAAQVACPVVAFKQVRSSTGHSERRPVIATPISVGDRTFEIDITLTARDEMGFRMLIGRAALRRRFWVDPGRSFLHGDPRVVPLPRKRKKTQ